MPLSHSWVYAPNLVWLDHIRIGHFSQARPEPASRWFLSPPPLLLCCSFPSFSSPLLLLPTGTLLLLPIGGVPLLVLSWVVVPCFDKLLNLCTRAPWTTPRVKGFARGREDYDGAMVVGGEPLLAQPNLRLWSMRDHDIKYVGLMSSLRSRWRVSHRWEWHREGRHRREVDGCR